ncbi:MAG: radical SAM protein [Deltaproteobacteria bacterium]|nr:radical SAM protein [Deltaproteobacteria bacterium]
MAHVPAYVTAHEDGTLKKRAKQARQALADCTLCPRNCHVNRSKGKRGVCRTGAKAVVASFGPHFGEESPLVGQNGSGTIFFSYCNLLCDFCQNWEISRLGEGREADPEEIAGIMLSLARSGCHNINFVTPSHVVPMILEAVSLAAAGGLSIPLVYNSSGYDKVSTLKLLDGVVDIYMPDFKFWDPEVARSACNAPDYPDRAREALVEMHRQVGDLVVDERGIATRGLLVRHLVLPGNLAGTRQVMDFLARKISPDTYVNVMPQYRPLGHAPQKPGWDRGITHQEFEEALSAARRAGLTRLDRRWA